MVQSNDIKVTVETMIGKINEKNPYLVVGLAVGLILAGYYFVFLQAKIKEVAVLGADIRNQEQALKDSQNNIGRLGQYREELKRLNDRADWLDRKIRSRDEIPAIMENLSRLAVDSGVKIEQVMPHTDKAETILKAQEGHYVAIPIIIGARGGYHNFGKFLGRLEAEGSFLNIPDFAVMSNEADNHQHLVKLILKVLIFEKVSK